MEKESCSHCQDKYSMANIPQAGGAITVTNVPIETTKQFTETQILIQYLYAKGILNQVDLAFFGISLLHEGDKIVFKKII